MDPFGLFGNMTLTDFMSYIDGIEFNIKKKNEKYSNSKLLATQLYVLKQVLNSMQI